MKYLKVKWLHNLDDRPVVLYSELGSDRVEVRKVEIFPSGSYGYACSEKSKGKTRLSIVTVPQEDEIAKDLQFIPEVITRDEFEEIWVKATKKKA